MTQVAVRLDDEEIAALDGLVRAGRFASRAAAIRAALASQRRAEADRAIEAAYARGYGRQPQEVDALPEAVALAAIVESSAEERPGGDGSA